MIDLNKYVGVPFLIGGRTLKGIDCWGLVIAVYAEAGISVPDFDSGFFSKQEILRAIRDGEQYLVDEIPEPEKFCLVGDSVKGHIGLWLNGNVLHASRTMGVVLQGIDTFRHFYPASRFYRLKFHG